MLCDSVAWYSDDDRAGCNASHLMTSSPSRRPYRISTTISWTSSSSQQTPKASATCWNKMPLLLQYLWQSIVSHRQFQPNPCLNSIQLQPAGESDSTPHSRSPQPDSRHATAFYNRNSFWMTITSILAVLGGLAFFLAQKPYWDWTAQKDFLEYCQSLSNVNQNVTESCDRALTIPLPPPPFSRIHVTRRITDRLPAPHHDAHPLLLSQNSRFYTGSKPMEVIVVSTILLALAILVSRRAKTHMLAWKLKRNLLVIRSTSDVGSDEERVLESLGQSTPGRSHPTSHTTTLGREPSSFPRRRAVAERESIFSGTDSIPSLFPLLVGDFEDYKTGFKHLPPSRFKRVSNKLGAVKRAVKAEESRFMNTVKHMTQIMASGEYSGRFGPAYPVYENSMISIKQTMGELHELFSSRNGQAYWTAKGEAILHKDWEKRYLNVLQDAQRKIAILKEHNLKLSELAKKYF